MISVIIPIYKVEKYLEKCVESVFAQTYEDYELILVDDGTGDSCAEMSDEYGLCDTRVITIHKPNGGLSDARNKGLDIAAGEYINFLDSDDYVTPEMLAEMKTALEDQSADMCICGFNRVDEHGNVISMAKYKDVTLTRDETLKELISGNVIFSVAWAKLYKKHIFANIRYPKGKIHEDEYVAHYVIKECDIIKSISVPLYQYLQRDNSIMGKIGNNIKEYNIVVDVYIDRLRCLKDNKDELYANMLVSLLAMFNKGVRIDDKSYKEAVTANRLRINSLMDIKRVYRISHRIAFKCGLFKLIFPIYSVLVKVGVF